MKKYLLGIILCACLTNCSNRPKLNKNALVAAICDSFTNDDIIEADTIKVERIFREQLAPYLQDVSRDSAVALSNFVYIRLQRECVAFKAISDRLGKNDKKSDFKDINIEPVSEIRKEDYDTFFKFKHLKYLEFNGDTTLVDITDSSWEDRFKDGTYSRLSLGKINQNEFVLTFIESNNKNRKNYSQPGDKYRYKILKKDKGYYSTFVQAVGSKMKSLFKIYY